MNPLINRLGLLVAVALLASCANMGKTGSSEPPLQAAEKPELPAEYANALDLLKRKQWVAAENALNAWGAKNPTMSSVQVNLALLYQRTNRDDEARAAIAKALEINPKEAAAHNLLGMYAREAGDFSGARSAYETAIASNPQYPNAHLNLAILLDLYLHQPRQALPHYEHYAQLIGEEQLDQDVKSWMADAQRQAEGK